MACECRASRSPNHDAGGSTPGPALPLPLTLILMQAASGRMQNNWAREKEALLNKVVSVPWLR